MAVLHDAVAARPAIVSALAALAIHAAVVIGLPHARARALDLVPRPVEVDFAEPPVPPPPPPPPVMPAEVAPAPVAARGGPSTALRASAANVEKTSADETIASDQGDVPFVEGPRGPSGPPSGPGTGTAPLPAAPPPPPPPPPPTVDRSRAPALASANGQWSCPWPDEADHVDDAVVTVTVVVDATGHATKVDVLTDPGHGFAREARRCALRAIYVPALDRDGVVIASRTKPFRVRFSR